MAATKGMAAILLAGLACIFHSRRLQPSSEQAQTGASPKSQYELKTFSKELAAILLALNPSPSAGSSSELLPSFASRVRGKMILAPLTRGGNLPFRRLCADFGCEASMGEMVFARDLLKGNTVEAARLRRASNEPLYGVQIATRDVDEGIAAAKLAAESGADFVDLNCGCPIHEATSRGLGSSMLQKPNRLEKLVRGVASQSPLPFTVKIRLAAPGCSINVRRVVKQLRDAGAAAVTIHGRTADARYTKTADWELIKQVVEDGVENSSTVPIVGNGDILTWYEARHRLNLSSADAVMVGRGALIKPWIFQEFKTNSTWEPSSHERIEIYYRLTRYMKEHFGDDDIGRQKVWHFLPWHFDFFTRFQPYPEEEYAETAREIPLIQTRMENRRSDDATPLERLLLHPAPAAHQLMAAALWESTSVTDAISKLTALAEGDEIAAIDRGESAEAVIGDTGELSNIPGDEAKKKKKKPGKGRVNREPPPKRTPEEIEILRAQRAAKRALTGGPPHVDGRKLKQKVGGQLRIV